MSKIFNTILLVCVLMFAGCATVSYTETTFNGETKGFNPYGDGNVEVTRVRFTGTNQELVEKVIELYNSLDYSYAEEYVPEDIPDHDSQ